MHIAATLEKWIAHYVVLKGFIKVNKWSAKVYNCNGPHVHVWGKMPIKDVCISSLNSVTKVRIWK